jgi:hypothetical protein
LTQAIKGKLTDPVPTLCQQTPTYTNDPLIEPTLPVPPGQIFQMDMGFVRSTKYQQRDKDGHLVTSIDGYNGYLIVVDCATRYTWLFFTHYKTPPLDIIRGFLQTHVF